MLVSVIVPIYNIAPYLYQCVNSVINQTYKNLEIILVNDGSSDESPYLCEYFKKIDSRVRVIHKKNGGLVRARKSGLSEAKGEYVFYIDGDDWVKEDCIESYISEALKYKSDIVIASHYREFIGVFKRIDNAVSFGFYDKKSLCDRVYPVMIAQESFFRHGIYTYSWGKLYKREFALRYQLSVPDDLTIGEDAAFLYPLLFEVDNISIIDYCGYVYRHRPNSMLKTYGVIEDEIKKIATLCNYLSRSLDKDRFKEQIDRYFFYLALVRSGVFLENVRLREYLNFLHDVPRMSRVVLYNSGSFGQRFYKAIKSSGYYDVVAWVDEDHYESKIMGLPVVSPLDVGGIDFDYIIIVSFDPSYIKEAKALLERNTLAMDRVIDLNRYIKHLSIGEQIKRIKNEYHIESREYEV